MDTELTGSSPFAPPTCSKFDVSPLKTLRPKSPDSRRPLPKRPSIQIDHRWHRWARIKISAMISQIRGQESRRRINVRCPHRTCARRRTMKLRHPGLETQANLRVQGKPEALPGVGCSDLVGRFSLHTPHSSCVNIQRICPPALG